MAETRTEKVYSRLKPTLGRKFDVRCAELGMKRPEGVEQAIERWLSEERSQDHQTPAITIPTAFDQLADDQRWLIHNLVEIMQTAPQGSIFQALDTTLNLAVNEYRKTRKTETSTKAARPSRGHDRPKTGT